MQGNVESCLVCVELWLMFDQIAERKMFKLLNYVVFLKILYCVVGEAPLPSSFYSRPNQNAPVLPTVLPSNPISSRYGSPTRAIPSTSYGQPEASSNSYGAPAAPSNAYGAPAEPANAYGAPQAPVDSYGPPATPAAIITKHVYVHIPPPEPEYTTPRRPVEVLPVQKHYRIIFIKAPTQAPPTLPAFPAVAENEEKTLVYVLVKRPDEAPEIVMPPPTTTVPSKPEVYFIRYKANTETTTSEAAQEGGYYKK